MENITIILQGLEHGKISSDNAEYRILRLFNVSGQLPLDIEKYPYHGICGKCGNYRNKLDKDCLCQTCYQFGVRKLGGMIPDEIFKFVKPRF